MNINIRYLWDRYEVAMWLDIPTEYFHVQVRMRNIWHISLHIETFASFT